MKPFTLMAVSIGCLLAMLYGVAVLKVGALGSEFYNVKVTDVAQAVGALGTLLVAWAAYQTWRRPDDAKRRADTATEIIRASRKFETALIASRTAHELFIFQGDKLIQVTEEDLIDALKAAVKNRSSERLEKAHELANGLHELEPEAEAILGDEAAKKVKEMYAMYQRLDMAYLMAPHFYDGFSFPDEERRRKLLKDTLHVLGIRGHGDGKHVADPFEMEVQAAGSALRRNLLPFLVAKLATDARDS